MHESTRVPPRQTRCRARASAKRWDAKGSDERDTSDVTTSAPDSLEQLGRDVCGGSLTIGPKHIVTEDFIDIPAGVVPPADDPTHSSVTEAMALCRHSLGVLIWLSNAYIQAAMPTNTLCANMAFPHPERTLVDVLAPVLATSQYKC